MISERQEALRHLVDEFVVRFGADAEGCCEREKTEEALATLAAPMGSQVLNDPTVIRDCHFMEPVTIKSYGLRHAGRGFWKRLGVSWKVLWGCHVAPSLAITGCLFTTREAPPYVGGPLWAWLPYRLIHTVDRWFAGFLEVGSTTNDSPALSVEASENEAAPCP
ncbi:hypothetical protein LCGC14_1998410 [marine sediment metagenome]|uniref:Uncharacterized protein n=1 Tax=marine sediment metagenome TaxID=412755 RepID=A0A0F9I118_9ZZZZ